MASSALNHAGISQCLETGQPVYKVQHVVCDRLVECTYCGRKQHQVCTLHMEQIWPNEFVCALCAGTHAIKRRDNKYIARSQSLTMLANASVVGPLHFCTIYAQSFSFTLKHIYSVKR